MKRKRKKKHCTVAVYSKQALSSTHYESVNWRDVDQIPTGGIGALMIRLSDAEDGTPFFVVSDFGGRESNAADVDAFFNTFEVSLVTGLALQPQAPANKMVRVVGIEKGRLLYWQDR